MLRIFERLKNPNDIQRKTIESCMVDIHCALPATVDTFDPDSGTVTAKIMIRQKININGNITWQEIPLCVDCPVINLKAGGFVITFPIKSGDEGWLFFADNQIDHFWETGKMSNQSDIRFHDLSDGFFLPSTLSLAKKVSSYNTSNLQIRNDAGTSKVELTSGGDINIQAANNVNIQGKNFLNHEHLAGTLVSSTGPVTGQTGGVTP